MFLFVFFFVLFTARATTFRLCIVVEFYFDVLVILCVFLAVYFAFGFLYFCLKFIKLSAEFVTLFFCHLDNSIHCFFSLALYYSFLKISSSFFAFMDNLAACSNLLTLFGKFFNHIPSSFSSYSNSSYTGVGYFLCNVLKFILITHNKPPNISAFYRPYDIIWIITLFFKKGK